MKILQQEDKNAIYKLACLRADELLDELQNIYTQLQLDKGQETKSTAGDKHEVGRAMVQIEEEKLQKQINEAQRNSDVLLQLNTEKCSIVKLGSIVQTNKNTLYISSALGKIDWNGNTVMCVSVQAPIAQALLNYKVGEKVQFNNAELLVEAIL